jgi:hypothetical protein
VYYNKQLLQHTNDFLLQLIRHNPLHTHTHHPTSMN